MFFHVVSIPLGFLHDKPERPHGRPQIEPLEDSSPNERKEVAEVDDGLDDETDARPNERDDFHAIKFCTS